MKNVKLTVLLTQLLCAGSSTTTLTINGTNKLVSIKEFSAELETKFYHICFFHVNFNNLLLSSQPSFHKHPPSFLKNLFIKCFYSNQYSPKLNGAIP